MEQAAKLMHDFSGHDASETIRADLPIKPGFVMGPVDGILYTATRDGKDEKYIHKFKKRAKPTLAASHDGKQLYVVGGQYEVTEAGIEDR